jgi:hypothetical protein
MRASGVGFGSLGWSIVVRAASFPVTAICVLLSTALTIRYAGVPAYGAIAVVATLSQLLPYADLGIGAGVMTAISTTQAGSVQRLGAVASALRWLLIPTTVLIVTGILGATVFSWSELLGIASANVPWLDWATAGALVLFAIGIPLGIGQRVLVGLSMNPLAVGLNVAVPLITLASTWIVVSTGAPVAALAVAPASGVVLSAALSAVVGLKLIRFKFSYLTEYQQYHQTGLIAQGVSYLVLLIALALAFQFGRILLAQAGDLNAVAEYSLMMQLYLPIWSFFSVGGVALWPIFARNRMDRPTAQFALVSKVALLFGFAAVFASLGIVFFGNWVGGILSDGMILISMPVLLTCSLFLTAQAVQFVFGMALTTREDLRFQAWCAVPMAVFVVILIATTVGSLGPVAPFLWSAVGVLGFQVAPNILRVGRASRATRDGS